MLFAFSLISKKTLIEEQQLNESKIILDCMTHFTIYCTKYCLFIKQMIWHWDTSGPMSLLIQSSASFHSIGPNWFNLFLHTTSVTSSAPSTFFKSLLSSSTIVHSVALFVPQMEPLYLINSYQSTLDVFLSFKIFCSFMMVQYCIR